MLGSEFEKFIRAWLEVISQNGPNQGLVDRDFRLLSSGKLSLVLSKRRQFNEYLRSLIVQGVEEGLFDPNLDVTIAVNVIFTLLSTNYRWFRETGRLSYAELAQWYTRFILRGLSNFDPFEVPTQCLEDWSVPRLSGE